MNKYKLKPLNPFVISDELEQIGFDTDYINFAKEKYLYNLIKISSLRTPAANILKQTALSKGADLGVSRNTVTCASEYTDGILGATNKQLSDIIKSIKDQPFGLNQLADELETFVFNKNNPVKTLKINNTTFNWGSKTYLMGILNITPDSFSDGGEYLTVESALKRVEEMVLTGTDIVDIGGESTRPYSRPVNDSDQITRIIPVIDEIKKQFPEIVISVDTRSHIVAQKAIDHGANIINDVSGLHFDRNMISTAAQNNVPVVIMHSPDTPDTMQINPKYTNIINDINHWLIESVEMALNAGIKNENIIIDPGIGFGKTSKHNQEILKRINELRYSGYPLLTGTSRKKFTSEFLGDENSIKDEGTLAISAYLISQGVDILRVHNTKIHYRSIALMDSIIRK